MQQVASLTEATRSMVRLPTRMPILEKAYGTGRMVLRMHAMHGCEDEREEGGSDATLSHHPYKDF